MKQIINATSKLVDVLIEKNHIYLEDRIIISDEQVERELNFREQLDISMQDERQAAIDELFPKRTTGSLRGVTKTIDKPFEFDF